MADDQVEDSTISKDGFIKLIHAMDEDNNGTVEWDEYKRACEDFFPEKGLDEIEKEWKAMDKDGDGHLTAEEIGTFFGFSWDGDTAAEMTDEQILRALQMHDKLVERAKPAPAASTQATEAAQGAGPRDTSLIVIPTDKNKRKAIKDVHVMCALQESIELRELMSNTDGTHTMALLDTCSKDNISVRFVDGDKGESCLHKLARTVADKSLTRHDLKEVFKKLTDLMKEQAEACSPPRRLANDVNIQSKDGKTALFVAVEYKNLDMIDFLYSLGVDGPDTLLINSAGWTILHAATQACSVEVLKKLFIHFTDARKKVLLGTRDKSRRQPLHIAAYQTKEEQKDVVELLIQNGAKNDCKDSAGNVPSQLAERTGRRASKELIEEMTGQKPTEGETPRDRRRSKE